VPSQAIDTFEEKTLKVTQAVSAAILNLRPELIHAHDVNMIEAVRWASDKLKIPWVYDAHEWIEGSDNILPEIHKEWIRLERGHIQSASAVVTVSPKIAEILASAYDLKPKPEVVLNAPFLGDHKQRGPSVRSAAGVAEDTPLFVYSGKISVPRGLPTLLDAIASEPTFHLAVVCNPAAGFYGRLKQRQGTDLGGRLHILPMVDSRDVTSYLRDASVGVHPMTHFPNAEVALPNKLFEYLHAGVPIVVSDVEMMSKFVRDYGLGAVFAAGDVSSLRDALHEALGKAPEIRRKLEQDANLKARFSWEHQAHALRGVYQSALATSRAKSDRDTVNLRSTGQSSGFPSVL
jgi:glycosyltransferase involved in cell wall biosynthesis